MKQFLQKLRIIYVPYVLVFLGVLIGYTFLHWLSLRFFNDFDLSETIVEFVLPVIISGAAIWACLWKRIGLLNLKTERGGLPFVYAFLFMLSITISTVIAQTYIEKQTGKLTKLKNVSEISSVPKTKYYKLDNYYVDKVHATVNTEIVVSGKHKENLNYDIYVAIPVINTVNDTPIKKIWLGVAYYRQVNNNISQEDKESIYKQFVESVQHTFDSTNFHDATYFELQANNSERKGVIKAISKETNVTVPIILKLHTDEFTRRSKQAFFALMNSLWISGLIMLILIIVPKLNKSQKAEKKEKAESFKYFALFFMPKKKYVITPIILYINIAVFLIMIFQGIGFESFQADDLIKWGANSRSLVVNDGQWWRLFTAIFVHAGVLHLLNNMYGLIFVSIFLEPFIGSKRYLTAYLLMGVIASCTSIYWHADTVSVGASGAIMGLYGLFLALIIMKTLPSDQIRFFLINTLIFVGFTLLLGLSGGIDNAAHVGGLVSGFILGLIFTPSLKIKQKSLNP